jgi:hypothetical protein
MFFNKNTQKIVIGGKKIKKVTPYFLYIENMKTNVLHCNCKDLINVVTHINEDQIYQSIVKQPSHEVRERVSLL